MGRLERRAEWVSYKFPDVAARYIRAELDASFR